MIDAPDDTIRHLRDAVAAFLDAAETRLQAHAIRIYKNESPGSESSPTELNDASPLTTTVQYEYTAFEVFTTAPLTIA
jgi:hypothetical protein